MLLAARFLVISWFLCLQASDAFMSCFTRAAPRQYTNKGFSLSMSDSSVSVGFIGCGTIAKAIATGLATQNQVSVSSVAVSRRSDAKSTALQESFPELVSVHDDNQDVVDKSDIVFITVLPQQTSAVLQSLAFDEARHTLVSLVSTSTLEGLAADSKLPPEKVAKVICLPSVAMHQGVSLVIPKQSHNPSILDMLSSLGGFVECETQDTMNSMMVTSGLMGVLYGVLKNNRNWLVRQGVAPKDASYYVGRMHWGMMQDAVQDCDDPRRFDDLVEEQTPGGLNEQALDNLEKLGVMKDYDTVMDALLSRLEGKSDGSLPYNKDG